MTVTRRASLVESTKLMEAALDGVPALNFFHSERLTPQQQHSCVRCLSRAFSTSWPGRPA